MTGHATRERVWAPDSSAWRESDLGGNSGWAIVGINVVDFLMWAALRQGVCEGTWGQTKPTFGGLGPGDSGPFGPCLIGIVGE